MARPQTKDPAASLRQLLTDLEAMDAGELRSAWLENEEQVRATLRGLDGTPPSPTMGEPKPRSSPPSPPDPPPPRKTDE